MEQETQPVESPCIRNCCLDVNDICMGCFRSLSEITAWGMVDNVRRREILQNSDKRRKLKFER
ncbi:MAG: DUF1289 domain-containing protein [Gammaproteobacteria bacterium]